MNVGMMLRNIHTGDEQMIVDMYEQVVGFQGWKLKPNLAHSKLSTVVYVLEDKEGERHNWNATYMDAWEIVKQKILFREDVECIACKENTFHERFERCLSCGSGMNLWSEEE
jgi:hypothetical protein